MYDDPILPLEITSYEWSQIRVNRIYICKSTKSVRWPTCRILIAPEAQPLRRMGAHWEGIGCAKAFSLAGFPTNWERLTSIFPVGPQPSILAWIAVVGWHVPLPL